MKKMNQKRKRTKIPPPLTISNSPTIASFDTTYFPLLLAAAVRYGPSPPLLRLLLRRLRRQITVTSASHPIPPSLLSLLPLLLSSNSSSVIALTAELAGLASLKSIEQNERIASDNDILKGLILSLASASRKSVEAALNAVMDLCFSSFARERLRAAGIVNQILYILCQENMNSSQDSARGIFGRNKLLNLFLKTVTTLINSSKTDSTDQISSELIQKILPLFSKILKTDSNHELAETIFRLSINTPIPIKLDSNELKSSIFGKNNSKFNDFFSNYWEKSPILLKKGSKNSEENNSIFTSLSNKWRNSDSITDTILQDLISCPPISSDELNINNFLTELTPHSFTSQLITNQDIKTVKTEGPNRKTEIPHSSTPQLITNQDIKTVKTEGPNCKIIKTEGPNLKTVKTKGPNCKIIKTEGPNLKTETHSLTSQLTNNNKIIKTEGPNRKTETHYPINQDYSIQTSKEAFNNKGYSIALKALQVRNDEIALASLALSQMLGLPSIGVNLYLSPRGAQGLAAHFDDHCVLVWQLIGSKFWTVVENPLPVLPRLYDKDEALNDDYNNNENIMGVLVEEGDVLYVPRGCFHEARTDINARCSLHLTFAIEVERPFEWEGFAHVALHCWYKKLKQNSDNFFLNSKFENPNLTFTLLSHISIKLIGDHDSTFRKACLVASNYQIPSQKSIFDQIFSKIDEKSNFLEAFNWIKLVCEKRDEDSFQCLRWLRHLDQNEIIICNLLENLEKYVVPCSGNMDEAKDEFDNFKGCFCKYVVYEDVCVSFGNLLEKYRKVRGQYMKGMLGLHGRY
ncbi:hypothetical protein LUZ60_007117 [Juncus effusus]|nr:hypothetical protein LUZ60_007117 [Juncus effusus]